MDLKNLLLNIYHFLTSRQEMRFIIGGGIGGSLYFSVYWGLEALGITYLIASVPAFLAGASANFIVQKHWTFKNTEKKNVTRQFFFYALIKLAIMGLNTGILFIGVEYARIGDFPSQIIAMIVVALVGWLTSKRFFKNPVAA